MMLSVVSCPWSVLAEVTSQGPTDTLISGAWVISLVVAVIGALAGGVKLGQSRVKIEGQPLEISMRDKFLTRTEFLEFKSDIKADVREMRLLFDRAVQLVTDSAATTGKQIHELGEQLHSRITQANDEAAERRRRIHDKLNEHQDKIVAIDTRTEVSKSIGKLGAAILTLAKKDHN